MTSPLVVRSPLWCDALHPCLSSVDQRTDCGRAQGMGVPSYNHDRRKVGNDRPDHLYAARIHHRKSLDARRIVARSYFRSLRYKLYALLEGTDQGPEGQGCWYEVEPEQMSWMLKEGWVGGKQVGRGMGVGQRVLQFLLLFPVCFVWCEGTFRPKRGGVNCKGKD